MDIKNLYGTVLIFIVTAMLVGVGVLSVSSVGRSIYATGSVLNESHTWTNNTLITVAKAPIISVSSVKNATGGTVATTGYMIHNADLGQILVTNNATISDGETARITYTYEDYGVTGTTTDSIATAVGAIGTTWMSLLITIAVLALIIGLVVSGFAMGRRR